jgi:hypothetical protein
MQIQNNLLDTFRASEIGSDELSEIARWYFTQGVTRATSTEVLYGLEPDHVTYALKFVYKGERLAQILAGPALTTKDICTIKDKSDIELRQPVPVRIGT